MKNDTNTDKTKQKIDEEIEKNVEVHAEESEQVSENKKGNEEAEELKKKLAELDSKYKRALADYQNLEKRVREDRIEWIKSANKDLIQRLLAVLDTLLLASQHSEDQTLQVTLQQFLEVLKAEGVKRIETIGKKFDPVLMEAVHVEEGEEGKVLKELRAGFMIYEKLLRPAQVVVGKALVN